jgi:hypothetical protein
VGDVDSVAPETPGVEIELVRLFFLESMIQLMLLGFIVPSLFSSALK